MLGIVSVMMILAIALGLFAYRQYQQTAISELKAIALSSEALFACNKSFDALLQAIKAKERSSKLTNDDANLRAKVDAARVHPDFPKILICSVSILLTGHPEAGPPARTTDNEFTKMGCTL